MNNLKADLWAWLIFVLVWGYIVYNFNALPERVPVHFNIQGEPDRFGHPSEVFISLVTMLPYFFLLFLNPANMGIKGEQNQQNFAQTQQYARILLILLPSSIALGQVLNWQGMLDQNGTMKVIFTMVGVFLTLMGNVAPRVPRNTVSGFRTAYTLRSDRAWYEINRKSAYLMTACGCLIVILTWILPGTTPIFGLLASIVAMLLGLFFLNRRARVLWEQDPKRVPLEEQPF
ncbi:DUF1648 domain-containing protein [Deinococcus misasensis]|uniref:DUF1648 domain-containing protein n=1 Tax=Deinococcus misasensis TaxID=392413 RepID=UPI000554C6D2|nr:DUF1648 domain-containing protein [Deinococcus misasensis]